MPERIYVSVTCDTEFLPPWNEGTWRDMAAWSFQQGTPIFRRILDDYGVRGTFFAQGTVLEQFPDIIRDLHEAGHHIGSHGYNHENYGGKPVRVWTRSQPVFLESDSQKRELIEKSIDIHKQVLGKHPEAFVAPFDSVDRALLMILDELDFKVDCSFHNYSLKMNSFPFLPLEDRSLVEIPLTVLDMGTDVPKNVLEAFAYNPDMAKGRLDKYVDSSLKGCPFCMVLITCHPYEFLNVNIPHPRNVLIVGPEKVRALKEIMNYFRKLDASFVTPLEIREIFADTKQ